MGKTSKIFCVPILNAMVHSKETRKILEPYKRQRKQSQFIREAILDFAFKHNFLYGMNHILENNKPDYINETIWQRIITAHRKTHYIKYGYVVAFYWLLSLEKFECYSRSKLMREIIITQYQLRYYQ